MPTLDTPTVSNIGIKFDIDYHKAMQAYDDRSSVNEDDANSNLSVKLRIDYNFPSSVLNKDRHQIIRTSQLEGWSDVTILDPVFLDNLAEVEHLEYDLINGKSIYLPYIGKITKPSFEFRIPSEEPDDNEYQLEKHLWDHVGVCESHELRYYSLPIVCRLYLDRTGDTNDLMMEANVYVIYEGKILYKEQETVHLEEVQSSGSLSRLLG